MLNKNELEKYVGRKIDSFRFKNSNTLIVRPIQKPNFQCSWALEIELQKYYNWLRKKKLLKLIK